MAGELLLGQPRGLQQIFVGNFPSFPLYSLLSNRIILPSLAILFRTGVRQCLPPHAPIIISEVCICWMRCEDVRDLDKCTSVDVGYTPEISGDNSVTAGTSVKYYKRSITYNGPNY